MKQAKYEHINSVICKCNNCQRKQAKPERDISIDMELNKINEEQALRNDNQTRETGEEMKQREAIKHTNKFILLGELLEIGAKQEQERILEIINRRLKFWDIRNSNILNADVCGAKAMELLELKEELAKPEEKKKDETQ